MAVFPLVPRRLEKTPSGVSRNRFGCPRELPKQLHSVMPSDLDRSSSQLSSSLPRFSNPTQPDRSTPALRTDNRRRSQATLSQGKRNLDRRGQRPGRRFPCHGAPCNCGITRRGLMPARYAVIFTGNSGICFSSLTLAVNVQRPTIFSWVRSTRLLLPHQQNA